MCFGYLEIELKTKSYENMERLISIREYVLRFDKPIGFYADKLDYQEGQSNAMSYVISYANLLSKKLELWMFVPCKFIEGVWVALEEPTCDCTTEFDREGCYDKCYEYINAKNRVLFDGFELNQKDLSKLENIICITKNKIQVTFFKRANSIFLYNLTTNNTYEVKTIEDLVKHNLELTPTAQKQIGYV